MAPGWPPAIARHHACLAGYLVPSPSRGVRVLGICDRPMAHGCRCSRRVRHHGWSCRHHRSEPLCGCQNDFLLLCCSWRDLKRISHGHDKDVAIGCPGRLRTAKENLAAAPSSFEGRSRRQNRRQNYRDITTDNVFAVVVFDARFEGQDWPGPQGCDLVGQLELDRKALLLSQAIPLLVVLLNERGEIDSCELRTGLLTLKLCESAVVLDVAIVRKFLDEGRKWKRLEGTLPELSGQLPA